MATEILYLTHNRREFTDASLDSLFENTPPRLVSKLWFFDDRSVDGTLELVELAVKTELAKAEVRRGTWDSPVTAMAEFFDYATTPLVAKIDSDVMLPPGWLEDCERVLRENLDIDVIGIEARGATDLESAPAGVARKATISPWVGGIFVARLAAIAAARRRQPLFCDRTAGKWFGWQSFQERAGLRCAWLRPSLQVFLLDRLPMEPWRSLSDSYVASGWQRPAPYRYGPEWSGLWSWWDRA